MFTVPSGGNIWRMDQAEVGICGICCWSGASKIKLPLKKMFAHVCIDLIYTNIYVGATML